MPKVRDSLVSARDAAPDVERGIERYFASHGLGDPPHVIERRVRDAACGCARVVDFRASAIHAGASARIRDTNYEQLVAELWAKLPPGGQ